MNKPLRLSAYRLPSPTAVAQVEKARSTAFVPSPDGSAVLTLDLEPFPPLELVARSFDALAGIRIDRQTGCRRRLLGIRAATIVTIETGVATDIAAVAGLPATIPVWAPDGEHLAFGVDEGSGISLAVVDRAGVPLGYKGTVVLNDLVADAGSNGWRHRRSGIAPTPVLWGRDGRALFCWTREGGSDPTVRLVSPSAREAAPGALDLPLFDGVLGSEASAASFDQLVASQLLALDIRSGDVRRIGASAPVVTVRESPDRRYLLVTRLESPYPLNVPFSMFGRCVEVWDSADGGIERHVATRRALQTKTDLHDTGPRQIFWQEGQPSTLLWAEQPDGGRGVEDVYRLMAPFSDDTTAHKIGQIEARLVRWVWLDSASEVLCNVRSMRSGKDRVLKLDTSSGATELVYERPLDPSVPDCIPLRRVRRDGGLVAAERDGRVFFPGSSRHGGEGSALQGVDLTSNDVVEYCVGNRPGEAVLGFAEGMNVMISRHSATRSQFVLHDLTSGEERTVVERTSGQRTRGPERLTFKGPDGQPQGASFYRGSASDRQPCVLWLDGRVDAQLGPIPRLASEGGVSVAFLQPVALAGNMPPEFGVDILVQQVHACVDEIVRSGAASPDSVFLGGHSYGAFLAALVLSHSDRFKAGIALSGAYSRSLTPFGFQTEGRSFWQAPGFYDAVDVVRRADKVRTPMLLVHGELDEVAGTPALQSELLFRALVANNTAARLVILPHEGHRYAARESVLHVLAELHAWVRC